MTDDTRSGPPPAAADGDSAEFVDQREHEQHGREHIAEQREHIADQREHIADEREREADERERSLDAWEKELVARASELGVGDPHAIALVEMASEDRARARVERRARTRLRQQAAVAREIALSTHEQVERRRRFSELDAHLALVFAGVAAELHAGRTIAEVRERVVEAALAMVDGCDAASITVLHEGKLRTGATTGPPALAADRVQLELGEGPSHDALTATIVSASSFPDPRWKELGTKLRDRGVASAVCYRLGTSGQQRQGRPQATLNLYAGREGAFSRSAQQVGLLLVAHGSIAVETAMRMSTLEFDRRTLLESSRLLARATGIVSARMHITVDEARDVLARTAHDLGMTRAHVAKQVIDTGSLPEEAEHKDRPD